MLTSEAGSKIMIKKVVSVGALFLGLTGIGLQAGTVVVGDPAVANTGNCDPFGCPLFFGLGTYQQVYVNSAFSQAITIDGISFMDSVVGNNGGTPAGGSYSLNFSYTSDAPGTLDLGNYNNNITAGEQNFFTGTLPSLTPSGTEKLLTFNGTPFAYDPSQGNLLLTVTVTGGTGAPPFLYLDQSECGPKTYCPAGSGITTTDAYFGSYSGGNDTGGLVTAFTYTVPTGVTTPEPSSLILVLAGIGGILLWLRRPLLQRVSRPVR